MDDPPESLGTILLPDNPETESADGFIRARNRSDSGFVIGGPLDLVGYRVWVKWTDGKWFDGFSGNGVYIGAQVRLYGIVNNYGVPVLQSLDESILAIEEPMRVRPYGNNLLILRSRPFQSAILSTQPMRDHKGVILDRGNSSDKEVGKEVVYQASGLYEFEAIRDESIRLMVKDQYGLDDDRLDDLALIGDKYVYGYV